MQTRIFSTARVLGEPGRGRGDRVVGLEFDHRPEDDPERLDGGLGDRELGEQLGRHPGRRLVARVEVVPEGFDDPVGGGTDVRGALLAQEVEQLFDEPGDARQRDPVAPEDRRPRREMRPEELVGRVDQVELTPHQSVSRGRVSRAPTCARRRRARAHLVERAVAVARLEVDGRDRVGQDVGLEAEPGGVERRRLDAVVGRQADDDDAGDGGGAQERLELGGDRLPADRVAHREARIAVLAVGALADPRRVVGECQVRVELRAPRARHAMDRPDAAVLGEMGVDAGCQSWVATTRAPWARAISRLIVGTIASPPATLRPPAGSAKSFWTSTTMRAVPGP